MKTFISLVCFLLICGANLAVGAEIRIGVIKNANGAAFVERNNALLPLKVGDKLYENDTIVTGRGGSMGLILRDNSVLSVGSNTRLIISKYVFEPAEKKLSMVARIKQGTLTYLTGVMAKLNPNAVRFETPVAVCGVRGTHFAIKVDES
jgi:hypothetical protein